MSGIFIEAENFNELGGWVIEQQSIAQMGSPYIMAHGLGIPVADAKTEFLVDAENCYTVWVRTRDWTAPWGNLQAGKFKISINGIVLESVLGTNGSEWAWQKAGEITLQAGVHTLSAHDLTGFNARVDAIYITANGDTPPNDKVALSQFRQEHVCPTPEEEETVYDLVVVGGGIAGVCTAVSASRSGCKALLIHDREVLGGCNSSEVRVCLGGKIQLPPYPKLGNIVKEIQPIMGDPNRFDGKYYEDDRKKMVFELYESAGRCKLALGEAVVSLTKEGGKIVSVETVHIKTGKRKIYHGKLFADCTGDAVISRLAGARTMYGREAKTEFNESLGAVSHEKLVMGHSIRWYSEEMQEEVPFPEFDTGMFQSDEDCLHILNGDWEQETGFRRNMAEETEYIRDYGLYVIFGNWSFQKNKSQRKAEYAKRRLKWVSPLGGKRESYRVVGDLILTQRDIEERVIYEDATASMTWSIDIHFPEAENEEKFGEAFRSFAYHRGIVSPYPVPYRCLYAKDVDNLFLGGRTVSTTHVAFAAIRVMRTLGMLGEVIGLAARVCRDHGCMPREVYASHLEELKALMEQGVPTPNAFECGIGSEEQYHFKDAGWFNYEAPEKIEESPYAEKVKKNVRKLNLSYKYKGGFDLIK